MRSSGKSLLQRIKAKVIQDVPSELAVCEFQCQRALCTHRNYRDCPLKGDKGFISLEY